MAKQKNAFPPVTREEMRARNIEQLDFVFVSGDAYIDHPSFGAAIITRLLESRGYSCGTPGRCMMQLMERLSSGGEFPHEIGLFLGYPPEDVEGFIRNKAECSKCCGHWKVYGDEHRARDLFNRYNQCTQAYCAQWMAGKSLEDLTVQIGQTDKMRRTIA